jgi:hypothetical protein
VNSFALSKLEIVQAWKDVHTAFYEELKAHDEHIRTVWTDEEITTVAAMSTTKPRELYISSQLLDRPDLRKENLYNLFCHELGHVLGGAPYIFEYPGDNRKVSSEGQADFFTTKRCMGRLFPPAKIREIYQELSQKDKLDLKRRGCYTKRCQVISHLSKESLERFGDYEDISFDKHDETMVQMTYVYRNSAQCRLDTFIAGAIARNQSDYYLAYSFGISARPTLRPRCWYKPLGLLGIPN